MFDYRTFHPILGGSDIVVRTLLFLALNLRMAPYEFDPPQQDYVDKDEAIIFIYRHQN